MRKRYFSLALLAVSLLPLSLIAQTPSLAIQVDHPTAQISPMLYGLMTEEINFSYDGGVYPELVRDRAIGKDWGSLFHWSMVARGESAVQISMDETTGPSEALPRSIKVSVTAASEAAPAGVQNDGFWGIAVRPQTTYTGSFYAKTDSVGVPVTVSLVNDETGATAATATVTGVTGEWKQYSFTLKTADVPATANNHLTLTVPRPSTLWLDLVSLFPPTYHDRPFGNRIDLMEKLAAMHPKFLRLPGGNYLEGDHIAERFDWKKTIGPWVALSLLGRDGVAGVPGVVRGPENRAGSGGLCRLFDGPGACGAGTGTEALCGRRSGRDRVCDRRPGDQVGH
jgi:alpha-N-arabinofuranosidase